MTNKLAIVKNSQKNTKKLSPNLNQQLTCKNCSYECLYNCSTIHTQHSSDNIPLYLPDTNNHHCSDPVYWKWGVNTPKLMAYCEKILLIQT